MVCTLGSALQNVVCVCVLQVTHVTILIFGTAGWLWHLFTHLFYPSVLFSSLSALKINVIQQKIEVES